MNKIKSTIIYIKYIDNIFLVLDSDETIIGQCRSISGIIPFLNDGYLDIKYQNLIYKSYISGFFRRKILVRNGKEEVLFFRLNDNAYTLEYKHFSLRFRAVKFYEKYEILSGNQLVGNIFFYPEIGKEYLDRNIGCKILTLEDLVFPSFMFALSQIESGP